MIHVDRNSVPPPSSLQGSEALEARERAEAFFSGPPERRRQQTFEFERPIYRATDVLAALNRLFAGKCAYCETVYGPVTRLFVDHFRPRSSALRLNGTFDQDHYFWLAYEWFNLYAVCIDCSTSKGQRFPIAKRPARLGADEDELPKEEPMLLDPCRDEPEHHLVFQENGLVASETERGQITIEVLSLNRPSLEEARVEALASVRDVLTGFERALEAGSTPAGKFTHRFEALLDLRGPYAAMRRQFAAAWLDTHWPDLERVLGWTRTAPGATERASDAVPVVSQVDQKRAQRSYGKFQSKHEAYTVQSKTGGAAFYLAPRSIRRVQIRNFRNIRDLTMTFPESQGSWTILLGENGTGKSSVLQAITLALIGRTYRNRLPVEPSGIVRRGAKTASVRVWLNGIRGPITMTFTERSRRFLGAPQEPKALLLGYGATRLLPRAGRHAPATPGFASVDNLFDPFTPLKDSEEWLLGLEAERFDSVARSLRKILPLDPGDELVKTPASGKSPARVHAKTGRALLTLDQLSDGFQSVVALATDIMQVMMHRWPTSIEFAEGIVLIDELEAHLHPKWKMQIVLSLRELFPRVQFIATTHDPLCLRGLRDGEVAVMRRQPTVGVYASTDLPSIQGLRADQLLTSEHFGLSSTIDPKVEALFDEYYALQVKARPSPDDGARLGELRRTLAGMELLGKDQRERLMLEAIDLFLARSRSEADPEDRQRMREHAIARAAEVFATEPPVPIGPQ
jgi:uncharacterized protein (TIGR02646 family)